MMKFDLIEEEIPASEFLEPSLVEAANDFSLEEVEEEVTAWKAENM